MKIFLDDMRTPPTAEWVLVKSSRKMIEMLKENDVEEISLDHDLGFTKETGYDVLQWIEEEVVINSYKPPNILIHTSNPAARERMVAARDSIYSRRNALR